MLHTLYGKTELASARIVDFFSNRLFLYFNYLWFLFQSIYIAGSTYYRIAPDSHFHLSTIRLFAQDGLDPFIQNQSGFFFLGDVIRHPGLLYHYLLSFVLRLSPFGPETEILLLRLTNIFIVFVGLVILHKLMKALKIPKFARNLTLFMLTNTLMFVYLSANINYDNMLFLVSTLTFYLLVVFVNTGKLSYFLGLLASLAVASLVKISFLPIGLAILPIAFYFAHKHKYEIISDYKDFVKDKFDRKKFKTISILFILVIASFIFVERYIGNILVYHTPKPKCTEIHSVEECSQNAIFSRGQQFKEISDPKLEFGFMEFAFRWSDRMRESTYTVISHKAFSETSLIKFGSYAFIGVMTVATIRGFDRRDKTKVIMLAVALYYLLVLMLINYFSVYRQHGNFGVALQGRYAFPILAVLYALGNYYVLKLFSKSNLSKVFYALFAIFVFLPSSLFWFIFSTGPEWHRDMPLKDLNETIRTHIRGLVMNNPLIKRLLL